MSKGYSRLTQISFLYFVIIVCYIFINIISFKFDLFNIFVIYKMNIMEHGTIQFYLQLFNFHGDILISIFRTV